MDIATLERKKERKSAGEPGERRPAGGGVVQVREE